MALSTLQILYVLKEDVQFSAKNATKLWENAKRTNGSIVNEDGMA